MKIKQLEYLVKIMECGSITHAAQEMRVSQPSLTKSISKLEEEYGIQIMIRKARGVEFTPQGLDFVHYAKGVLAAVHAYPKNDPVPPEKARLFIAAQQLDFIHPLLLEAYNRHCDGNVFFNLVETDRSDVARHILKGKADIGLVVRTSMDSKGLPWDKYPHRLDVRVIDTATHTNIAVGPKSPLWNRTNIKMSETAGYLHIALDLEEPVKQSYWLAHGQYENINNNRVVFVNTARACEKLLLETDALSFCSNWTKNCFDSSDIHVIPVEEDSEVQELILLRRKGEPMTVEETAFIQSICRRLGVDMIRFASSMEGTAL